MSEKRRRTFKVYVSEPRSTGKYNWVSTEVANGVFYDEGNVQVLWRKDIGFTAEQYANIGQIFGIVEGANTIQITEEDN